MNKEKPFDMELFFASLADKTRLRILNLIGDDEVCVCYLVEIIDTNQPKISRHLAYLKKAGLVSVRRDWKWSHYRIVKPNNEGARKVLAETLAWLRNEPEMQNDKKQMKNLCCIPVAQQPISIQGAPKPERVAV
ncbi:MAG TPA: metalloregulator ArsR/SmtB family transcription factor [Pyrinomonadaceae bacterium]|nr:metalloregulator ArsR/SmtB family transcription factor [Pyrinomonadaceae bacterium]